MRGAKTTCVVSGNEDRVQRKRLLNILVSVQSEQIRRGDGVHAQVFVVEMDDVDAFRYLIGHWFFRIERNHPTKIALRTFFDEIADQMACANQFAPFVPNIALCAPVERYRNFSAVHDQNMHATNLRFC